MLIPEEGAAIAANIAKLPELLSLAAVRDFLVSAVIAMRSE